MIIVIRNAFCDTERNFGGRPSEAWMHQAASSSCLRPERCTAIICIRGYIFSGASKAKSRNPSTKQDDTPLKLGVSPDAVTIDAIVLSVENAKAIEAQARILCAVSSKIQVRDIESVVVVRKSHLLICRPN